MTKKYTADYLAKPTKDAFRRIDRIKGALFGMAAGDAVGATNEFLPRGSYNLSDMVGAGPHHLRAGEWTDDTSMALCLGESLIARKGFDPHHQMSMYVLWKNRGHNSSNERGCFDIGGTVSSAIRKFESEHIAYAGSTSYDTAGNGSLMRLAPVPMFFLDEPAKAIWISGESSKTTHGSKQCVDACMYFAGLLIMAMEGERKSTILSPMKSPLGLWPRGILCKEVQAIADGSFKRKPDSAISGSGYVIDCLEAALWAFHNTDNFRDCILKAANLGQDADSTAAVAGQLAGAYYGASGIPAGWVEKLAKRNLIEQIASGLIAK